MRASNEYFAALLGPNYKEAIKNEVSLNDIDGKTLKAIVDYCYTNRININADNVDNLLDAASSMEFPVIEEMIAQFWCTKLNVKNCIEKLMTADRYFLMTLWQKGLQFCAWNFGKLPLPELLNIDEYILRNVLAMDEITVAEEYIFDCIVRWHHQNENEREKFMPAMLKQIRLKHITDKVNSIDFPFIDSIEKQKIIKFIRSYFSFSWKESNRILANMHALNSLMMKNVFACVAIILALICIDLHRQIFFSFASPNQL